MLFLHNDAPEYFKKPFPEISNDTLFEEIKKLYWVTVLIVQETKNGAKKPGCHFSFLKTTNPNIDVLCPYGIRR